MIDGIPLGDLTAPAVLLITVLLVLLGYLVPRKIYLDKVQECKEWKEAYELSEKARATSDAQTQQLLENDKTVLKVLTALAATFGAPEYEQQSGGAHAASVAK